MALLNKKDKIKSVENTGFSADKTSGERYITNHGAPNVRISGLNYFKKFSIYHTLLSISGIKFFFLIILFYSTINFLFACLYMTIGIHHLNGVIAHTWFENFYEAYFFSSQTLTTVGYGRVSPTGLITNILASFEALIGIMTLALITGLLYGRFTKPRPFIMYSKVALISPFKSGKALMFRLAPTKSNTLSDINATVTLAINKDTDGTSKTDFYNLPLQLDKIMSLALNWTLVHPINEESPLHEITKAEIDQLKVHIIVFIKGFDEGFSNTVVSRHEYIWEEIVTDAKFLPMYINNNSSKKTVLQLEKIDDYEKITV